MPVAIVGALLFVCGVATAAPAVVWKDSDDQPIAEPAEDEEGDFIWWDGTRNMTFYQAGKILDLGDSLRSLGEWASLVGPREAANVNALDEVPDSTWFTNRHHLRPLSPDELARGPNAGPPPSDTGALTVTSGKALGQTPGLVVEDSEGRSYFLKFDPPALRDLATGAEIVSSRILHALGWNVPEYHLVRFDPARLELGGGATTKDEYNRKRPMDREDLAKILEQAALEPDGAVRAVASLEIPGEPKGPFRTLGVRPDDPNDRIPHEDRRELRGLRVVAAWINYTDARRGNFYDTFVVDDGDERTRGHLVHYILDFSSALGSGNVEWKSRRDGNEYVVDPPIIFRSLVSLGFWVKPWEDAWTLAHPALGYLEASIFDPESWRTTFPNPLFDHATTRDSFWGAKLVTSFTDADLRVVVDCGEWSDPDAAHALFDLLRQRRQRVAKAYFRADRINPADRFEVAESALRFEDLAVRSGVAAPSRARYRWRKPQGDWSVTSEPAVPLEGGRGRRAIELETSHDAGESWSPTTRVVLDEGDGGRFEVVRIHRETDG